jgi:hypothetical protein
MLSRTQKDRSARDQTCAPWAWGRRIRDAVPGQSLLARRAVATRRQLAPGEDAFGGIFQRQSTAADPRCVKPGSFIPEATSRSAKRARDSIASGETGILAERSWASVRTYACSEGFIYFVMNRFFFCIRRQRHRVYLVSLARTCCLRKPPEDVPSRSNMFQSLPIWCGVLEQIEY